MLGWANKLSAWPRASLPNRVKVGILTELITTKGAAKAFAVESASPKALAIGSDSGASKTGGHTMMAEPRSAADPNDPRMS